MCVVRKKLGNAERGGKEKGDTRQGTLLTGKVGVRKGFREVKEEVN